MFRLNFIILFLITFLISGIASSEQGKAKIILENGYYYTQLENGEKFQIIQQQEPWAYNKVFLSSDDTRFAEIRTSNWQKYIDFYEVDEKGKVDLIKTYRVPTDQSLSDFKWSSDSKKFYYSYLFSNYQKVQVEVDLEDR